MNTPLMVWGHFKVRFFSIFSMLALASGVPTSLANADSAVPANAFVDAYRDGFVFTRWETEWNASREGEIREALRRVRRTGAQHVTIPFLGCQIDKFSNEVGSCELQSREFPVRVAELAIEVGLEPSFLPIMGDSKWGWRGFFAPTDVNRWFATYTAWIRGIAADADRLHMKELVVGSEFNSLTKYEDKWPEVFASVREVFHGATVMTVNWDDIHHSFWSGVDAIGVSAYYALSESNTPSQEELDQAWAARRTELLALAAQIGKPLHITEVGYANSDTAASSPWWTPTDIPANLELQAMCYRAFAKAWSATREAVRVNFWSTTGVEGPADALNGEVLGRPAEAVASEFFKSRLKLREPDPAKASQ